jgi:hypothetical protein
LVAASYFALVAGYCGRSAPSQNTQYALTSSIK